MESRAARVRAVTLQKQGEVERWAIEAGPPCTECRYQKLELVPTSRGSELKAYCGAPPAKDYRYDAVQGKVVVTTPITAAAARAPGGLCGIEAEMFHAKPFPVRYAKEVARNGTKVVYAIAGTGLAAGLLAAFFG